jgi:hypothetical protein
MKKLLLLLLFTISVSSCKEAAPLVEDTVTSEHVEWKQDYEVEMQDTEVEVQQDSVYNGETEWIWDGSKFDTLYPGATLKITNIEGDKVYLEMVQ